MIPSISKRGPIISYMDTDKNLTKKVSETPEDNSLYKFIRIKVFAEWTFFSFLAYTIGAITHPGIAGIVYFFMIPVALSIIIIQGALLCLFIPRTQYGKEGFKNFFFKKSVIYYFLLFHSIFAFTDVGEHKKYPNLIYREAGDIVGLISCGITIAFYIWLMVRIIEIYISTRLDYTLYS